MTATSGSAPSLLARHRTAPAASTVLFVGAASLAEETFGISTPSGQTAGNLNDAGGVPSATPGDRARSGPPVVKRSNFRRLPVPNTGWPDSSSSRTPRPIASSASGPSLAPSLRLGGPDYDASCRH